MMNKNKMARMNMKVWQVAAVIVLLGAAAFAAAATRPGGSGSLWTENTREATAGSSSWVQVAKAAIPGVVNISTTQVVRLPQRQDPSDPFEEFFRQYFGDVPRTLKARSLGSGFVIREDGYILTNNHVVERATEITVRLSDGRQLPGKVVGRDKKTEIALLKVEARGLLVISLGDSDKLQVGEAVMAIGNPFGLEGTVTTGIVSAKGRVIGQGPYDDFIQTDASINPGNSGGPLVNAAGAVVGVNTAIVSSTGGSLGIGFATPINMAKSMLPELQAKGRVTRGWLGVAIQPVTPDMAKALGLREDKGARVAEVAPDSPGAKAGLKDGDVILEYDGRPVAKASDLPRLVAATTVGRGVRMKVIRDGQPLEVTAQIAHEPQPAMGRRGAREG